MKTELAHRKALTRSEPAEFDGLIDQAYRELETSRRIAQGIVTNARNEAADCVARAKAEAIRIVSEARTGAVHAAREETERLLAEARCAYDTGYSEGLQQGASEGQRQFDVVIEKLGGVVKHLEGQKGRLLESSRPEIIDLVLRIADRVVRLERTSIRDVLAQNIRQVLEESGAQEDVTLHLNPMDATDVTPYLERFHPALRYTVRSDPTVPAGECRMRSRALNLDLSFERRFEAIRDRLMEALSADAAAAEGPAPEPAAQLTGPHRQEPS